MQVSNPRDYWMQDFLSSYKIKRRKGIVDKTKEEEGITFISIILQGIIQRSFGQWVHWSSPKVVWIVGPSIFYNS